VGSKQRKRSESFGGKVLGWLLDGITGVSGLEAWTQVMMPDCLQAGVRMYSLSITANVVSRMEGLGTYYRDVLMLPWLMLTMDNLLVIQNGWWPASQGSLVVCVPGTRKCAGGVRRALQAAPPDPPLERLMYLARESPCSALTQEALLSSTSACLTAMPRLVRTARCSQGLVVKVQATGNRED
jgi:hypothetical protein